jgi:hypothetical protein
MITTGDWRQMIRQCYPDDLQRWHPDWQAIDWTVTLAQPHWHLITDGHGSWCLLEPINGSAEHREGHLIIAPNNRGRIGLTIARDMLAWIGAHGVQSLAAKPHDRACALFLRWLGFRPTEDQSDFLRWTANLGLSSSRERACPPPPFSLRPDRFRSAWPHDSYGLWAQPS